jgi:hypothetical protein
MLKPGPLWSLFLKLRISLKKSMTLPTSFSAAGWTTIWLAMVWLLAPGS